MKPQKNSYKFSNRVEIREEVNFLAKYDWMPAAILALPIPMALQFALAVEIKSAIQRVSRVVRGGHDEHPTNNH
jgi:hypothetical protein